MHVHQGLSQDLETGCLKLAVVKYLGVHIVHFSMIFDVLIARMGYVKLREKHLALLVANLPNKNMVEKNL